MPDLSSDQRQRKLWYQIQVTVRVDMPDLESLRKAREIWEQIRDLQVDDARTEF